MTPTVAHRGQTCSGHNVFSISVFNIKNGDATRVKREAVSRFSRTRRSIVTGNGGSTDGLPPGLTQIRWFID
jgi:hypothetical protein